MTWSALEPSPYTDTDGNYWPNAAIVHDFATEQAARDAAAPHGWEVREHFWSTVPVVVDVPRCTYRDFDERAAACNRCGVMFDSTEAVEAHYEVKEVAR